MTDWKKTVGPEGRTLYSASGPNGERLRIADWRKPHGKYARFNAYIFTSNGMTQILSEYVDTFEEAERIIEQFLEGDKS